MSAKRHRQEQERELFRYLVIKRKFLSTSNMELARELQITTKQVKHIIWSTGLRR